MPPKEEIFLAPGNSSLRIIPLCVLEPGGPLDLRVRGEEPNLHSL